MVTYHVTIEVEAAMAEDWVGWMQSKHIPDVLKTGHFTGCRLTEDELHTDRSTRSFQVIYSCRSKENFKTYAREDAPALREEHNARYSGKFAASRGLFQDIFEF